MNISALAKTILPATKAFAEKYAAELLAGAAISTAIGATIAAAKGHLAAQDKRYEKSNDRLENAKNLVKARWRCYIPATALLVTSVSSVLALRSVQARRIAVVSAAYSLASDQLERYKSATVLHADEETRGKIQAAAAGDSVIPAMPDTVVVGGGEVLCYDTYSGRYFTSTMETIRRVENNINQQIIQESCVSLNSFYEGVGLEQISMGDSLGWNIDRMISLEFGTHLSEDGKPALAVSFTLDPVEGWYRLG